jgi:hypothetical protein
MSSANLDDDDDLPSSSKARVPPPVQPPTPGSPQRQMQPSVSIVEASKPSFQISVGDPHKVGDLATVHTEYLVSTKVKRYPIISSSEANRSRQLPKHTVILNSQYLVDFETFFGCTTSYTITTQAL